MFSRLRDRLREGVNQGVFPGAVLLAARGGGIVFFEAVGISSSGPHPALMEKRTIFDLASLTKPLATTPAMMKLVDEGAVHLDQPLSELLASSNLGDKAGLTPRLLLTHSAGLADWKPYHERLLHYPAEERKKWVRQWIIQEPFAYKPQGGNLYSDLGFMLLEWIIEERGGERLPAFVQRHFFGPLGLRRTLFRGTSEQGNPPGPPFIKGGKDEETKEGRTPAEEVAPTEDCPWRKKVLQGEVHDDNAWALGGYSGHAGLFSDAEGVYAMANLLREHFMGRRKDIFRPETVREFFRRQDIVKGSDWALGWDTRALEGSSAGRHFSRNSVGHTGFTGTSIWMDLERDVIAILLTNRVHPKRENDRIKQFRPLIHDTIMEELGLA
jgi:CubicO group peptidase (beta-lactamase class C family)